MNITANTIIVITKEPNNLSQPSTGTLNTKFHRRKQPKDNPSIIHKVLNLTCVPMIRVENNILDTRHNIHHRLNLATNNCTSVSTPIMIINIDILHILSSA